MKLIINSIIIYLIYILLSRIEKYSNDPGIIKLNGFNLVHTARPRLPNSNERNMFYFDDDNNIIASVSKEECGEICNNDYLNFIENNEGILCNGVIHSSDNRCIKVDNIERERNIRYDENDSDVYYSFKRSDDNIINIIGIIIKDNVYLENYQKRIFINNDNEFYARYSNQGLLNEENVVFKFEVIDSPVVNIKVISPINGYLGIENNMIRIVENPYEWNIESNGVLEDKNPLLLIRDKENKYLSIDSSNKLVLKNVINIDINTTIKWYIVNI